MNSTTTKKTPAIEVYSNNNKNLVRYFNVPVTDVIIVPLLWLDVVLEVLTLRKLTFVVETRRIDVLVGIRHDSPAATL